MLSDKLTKLNEVNEKYAKKLDSITKQIEDLQEELTKSRASFRRRT
jgi:uncharacterized coiled-coil protein SlyX